MGCLKGSRTFVEFESYERILKDAQEGELRVKRNVWIINHYAGGMFIEEGGRHYSIAKYLKRLGYDPVVFCSNAKHSSSGGCFFDDNKLWHEHYAKKIDVPFVFVKSRSYVGNGIKRIFNMMDFYFNVKKTAKEYAKLNQKPDIIYASSVHPLTLVAGLMMAKYFGIKCICEVRDLWPESLVAYGLIRRESIVTKGLYLAEKLIYQKADRIVMTWPGGYDYIIEKGWESNIPKDKVFHVSNGVDLEDYKNNRGLSYDNLVFDSVNKKFIYAGSIRKVNNIGLLVEAAKILQERNSDCHIVVFGSGDELDRLEEEAQTVENIVFMGRVEKKLIPSILSKSYATILHNSSTSLDRYGQSQNKLFEYLAAKRPILMTYSVGYSVCKRYGCGIEIQSQTPESIANSIISLGSLSDKEYQMYCKNAECVASLYDFYNLTNQVSSIIEAV